MVNEKKEEYKFVDWNQTIKWIIGLLAINVLTYYLIDPLIQNYSRWVSYIIIAILYVLWTMIYYRITIEKITKFINYKDEATEQE